MKNLDFEWLTDEFMLYCRSTQLREKTMSSYAQDPHLSNRCPIYVKHMTDGSYYLHNASSFFSRIHSVFIFSMICTSASTDNSESHFFSSSGMVFAR